MNDLTRRDVLLGTAAVAATAAIPALAEPPWVNEIVRCVEQITQPVGVTIRWRAALLLDGTWTIVDKGERPIQMDDLVEVTVDPEDVRRAV